jgi:hypothetical protein
VHATPAESLQMSPDPPVLHSPSRAAVRMQAEGSWDAFAALVSQFMWQVKSVTPHAP